MDIIDKKLILTQSKNVDRIITAFGVHKGAPTFALSNVMGMMILLLCCRIKSSLCH
jgi:hypothetical protein